jgi:hypothetical protein
VETMLNSLLLSSAVLWIYHYDSEDNSLFEVL